MSLAGESDSPAQRMREKALQLTERAERTTDPQERRQLVEEARRLHEQSKQQGQNAGGSRSKGVVGGGRDQHPLK
ncbi:DUF6381 family protein [Streptomyces sp. WAC01526]|uniref:DUF6381 family protein n=1 Tax=Streptomyces sp. WAC01526 TaxID=2588709 RepID=UPI0011DF29DF|nr:DUF6381 family protein [Streptomyces sp. WAC01526]